MASRRPPTTRISAIVSDVDGTLVTNDKQLTDRSRAAVAAIRKAGIPFSIISSRPPRGMATLMKALAIETAADLAAVPAFAAAADHLLFDARPPRSATRPGGHGAPFDWRILKDLDPRVPFMLSGGLDPDNVAAAIAATGAGGVDVSSGVERRPGDKDPALIRAFVAAARAATAATERKETGSKETGRRDEDGRADQVGA